MSQTAVNRRNLLCSIAMVMMFLFADLVLPSAMPSWNNDVLEEDNLVTWTNTYTNVTADTAIQSGDPTATYGSDASLEIGETDTGESRLLISVSNNYTSSDVIHSATLELTCGTVSISVDAINIYTARLKKSWDETNATWQGPDTNQMWTLNGADDTTDRGEWEPPYFGYGNNTFSIDVTALVQDAANNGRSSVNMIIAATGSGYVCHSTDHSQSTSHPKLLVNHSTGTPSPVGTLTPDFVSDGQALMNSDSFFLEAATTPDLSWSALSGSDVQVQLSLEDQFKSGSDDTWYYTTLANSSLFTISGTAGYVTVPSSDSLSNSTTMYYRMRAINNDQIGLWQSGYFHLPEHSVTDNGDNTASFEFTFDSLGLSENTIEDTYVDSTNVARNSNMGTDTTMAVGATSNSLQHGLMRLNMDDVGLKSNFTIVSASMTLARDSYSGSAGISVHLMENEMWTESDVTYKKYDGTNNWDEGGRTQSMSVDIIPGDQVSNNFEFNITSAVQLWLDNIASGSSDNDLELLLAGSTYGREVGSTSSVTFETTDANADYPLISITYANGSGSPPATPSHSLPLDGHGVWNVSVNNLSGNTTPILTWDTSVVGNNDMLLQLATDPEYRDVIAAFDTSIDNDFTPSTGSWTPTGLDSLSTGVLYHWRIAHRDTGGHLGWWQTSSFLVSGLESEYLSGDDHELRLRHGNATSVGDSPVCADTYIDSGSVSTNYNGEDEMQISYNTYPSETSVIMGCDLISHLLPDGYAVKAATLSMRLAANPTNGPMIGVWENLQHNWSEGEATWATYDGSNNWGTAGAKGWERSGLQDAKVVGTSYSAGDWVEFDVTLAVQNAMREDRNVDFILGVINNNDDRDVLFYPNHETSSSRPQLKFVYVPGSDLIPNEPTPYSPANGSWSVDSGIEVSPNQEPILSWNFNSGNNVTIGGWSVQLDTSSSFNSGNLIVASSWNTNGFDVANNTYAVDQMLNTGETWYWRVRATSSTNQIGNWSDAYHFLLPDLTTWSIDSNSAAVELHHHEAMPNLQLPHFIDTFVEENSNSSHSTSTTLKVGTAGDGSQLTSLIKIPLSELPNPQNAHISHADLNLYAQIGSDITNSISVHQSLVNWNTSANGIAYDGTNNWSSPAAMGASDSGYMSDILQGTSASWMTFDITQLVQEAFARGDNHLSLIIKGSVDDGLTKFTSTDGSSSDRPWLNLTWTAGNASTPESPGNNSLPLNNDILWDTSSHALLSVNNPTFKWTHANSSTIDDWRITIWKDYADERSGWDVYDSRESSTGWDLTNLSWTNPSNLSSGESYKWFVTPIVDDIIGARSSGTLFHLPDSTGESINSTDASISLQQGLIVKALDYPDIFLDTFIDTGSTSSSYTSSNLLMMGRSNQTSSSNHETVTLMRLNWSDIPIPSNYEFLEAHLELSKLSGGIINQETVSIAVCQTIDYWDENATASSPIGANTTGWSDEACDVPFEISTISYDESTIDLDLTYAIQHAHAAGFSEVSLGLAVVSETLEEWHFASSDYSADETKRPELSLTWRTGNQWLPMAPSGLTPFDSSTMWNHSSTLPKGADVVSMNWNSTVNNETKWVIQTSLDDLFVDAQTWEYDLTDSSTYNGTWDPTNLSYTTASSMEWGDYWYYWRVRAEQDHRLGEWSNVHSFRVPGEYGTHDGTGNNSLTLYQGSIFVESDTLPHVPDVTLDSNTPNTNVGSSVALDLGISRSGSGEAQILLEFDLGELPFPAAMTPTGAYLELYRENVTGTSSQKVSVHACSGFNEKNVTWNTAPVCSNAEVTRSTMLTVPVQGWQTWDITSLAQSNVANGNMSLIVLLKSVGTPSSTSIFYSSDYWNSSFRPKLVLEYVDNVNGVIPPAQPVLSSPPDGAILYNTTEWNLTSMDKPQLTWNPVTNATGYIVTVAEESGQRKYKSWEDSEINGTTLTFPDDLTAGSVYSWWVQAINGSIPGPSSSRSTFAIGLPDSNVYNWDHTWTYHFQTGNEIPEFGHTNIRDSYIGNNYADTNHGSESMRVGTFCEGWYAPSVPTECKMIIGLDNSQIPLPLGAKIHSSALNLQIEDSIISSSGGSMTLTVHRLLTSAWTQSGSTWNNSSPGVPWSTGGMTAGIEYEATPISSTIITASTTDVWLDIGHSNMIIDGDHAWVIKATSNTVSPTWVEFYSSESSLENRPIILINYTNVDSVSISPASSTTDADSQVQFSHILNDALGSMISEEVVWSASDGSINSTGVFTPQYVGTHDITACFGVICQSVQITVTPGAPLTLVVPNTITAITADQTYDIVAEVWDQHGNIVPGQTISYTPTNGTMSGSTFNPWSTGMQTITVGWNGQTIDVSVAVNGGVPTHYVTSGCNGEISAGTTCTLTWTLHDQFENQLDLAVGGGITWTATGGTFTESNGTYWAMNVGQHSISMLSTGGISHVVNFTIVHGEMAYLEIIASEEIVTADDIVWLNTTRIDVMGNRLPVVLPIENWTISDGMINSGLPAEWHAESVGTSTLVGEYSGQSTTVTIQVSKGAITGLVMIISSADATSSLQEITADDDLTVKIKAHDSDGNRWTENVAWRIEHPMFNDQSVLQEMTYGSTTFFVPTYASSTPYSLYATYSDNDTVLEVSLTISVEHGDLASVMLLQPASLSQVIDADDDLVFIPQLTDQDGNLIDPAIISYRLVNTGDSGFGTQNITSMIVGSGGVWDASEVGTWEITAWANANDGAEYFATVSIIVTHGKAVSLNLDGSASTAIAGDEYKLLVNGTDSDGNIFPQSVLWSENGLPVPPSTIEGVNGLYNWSASLAGDHTLTYRSPNGVVGTWDVNVSAHYKVGTITLDILQESTLQLETFEVRVQTFDGWGNQIPVPQESKLTLSGRMTAEETANGNWTITTLDEGKQTVTLSVHQESASGEISVDGTIAGFFEAGGTMYYVAAGFAGLIFIVLLVVILMVFRSGDSEYDDDDEDDDDYEYDEGKADPFVSNPVGPTGPGPGGPPPSVVSEPEEDTSWQVDHRVDDEGTEWAEDENGTWWYRDPGNSEWNEWTD